MTQNTNDRLSNVRFFHYIALAWKSKIIFYILFSRRNLSNKNRYISAMRLKMQIIFLAVLCISIHTSIHTARSNEDFVLVTGFKPFGDYDINPSEIIAEKINGTSIRNHSIIGISLDVDWDKCYNKTVHFIEMYHPSIVVSLGLAPRAKMIRLEKLSINIRRCEKLPFFKPIEMKAPFVRLTDINLYKIAEKIKKENVPCRVSYFAGFYMCNYLYYKLLNYKAYNNADMKIIFIHVPPIGEMSVDEMMKGVKIAIDYMIQM